jgi:hypothetical protein
MDCVLAAAKEQLSPGVTRIHGNLCNVHGRWARCPGAAVPVSKRVPMKRLPAAPKAGKRAAGRKRAAAPRKPIKTDAQREQERQAKRQQAQQQRQIEHEQNQAKVLHDLGIPEDAAGALADLAAGKPVDDDSGLVKMGLAEQGTDGVYRLTSTGRAFLSAAKAGDAGRARDAMGRASDQVAGRTERRQAADERKRAAEQRKADVEKRRAEAARLRAERLAKKRGGGGGKGKKPLVPKPAVTPPPTRVTSSRIAPVRGGGGGSTARQAPPKPRLAPELVDAAQQLSSGAEIDDATATLLIRNGLARYNKDGVLVLTAGGQRATMKAAAYPDQAQYAGETMEDWDHDKPHRPPSRKAVERAQKRFASALGIDTVAQKAGNPGDYLVVEDRTKPSTWHLQVKRNGKADHGLMGAAWAALHDGFRGNAYQGPGKQEALAKLKRLYEQEGMGLPSGKSFAVFKDASGSYRWIARTTTAYRDRDGEILSEKALEEDAARMTVTGIYGPLRYWHVGQPDPLSIDAPWGTGLDIGDCDFSIVIGRTSIESGTFKNEALGRAFADDASSFELSPGFFHAATEPDAATGVFDHIRRFERSTVPTKHGRASNLFTGLTVKEHSMDQATYDKRVQAYLDFAREKGIPPEAAAAPIVAMEQADKEAGEKQIAYKEEKEEKADKPAFIDLFRGFFTDETAATKEEAAVGVEPPVLPPDPVASLKEELAALRAEVASLKAPMDAETAEETMAEDGMEEPGEEGNGGLTLSSDDLAAIGQMFGGVLQSALEPLVGALGITQKLDGHMTELKNLMGGYVKQKEAGDGERANQVAALKATIDQQQAAITESQAKLTELLGDQPRNAGYRPSQAADNGAEAMLTAIKDGPPDGAPSGPFDDLISNLFPGLAQGGKP